MTFFSSYCMEDLSEMAPGKEFSVFSYIEIRFVS